MSPGELRNGGHSKAGHPQGTQINGGYPTGGYLKPVKAGQAQPVKVEMFEYPVSSKPAGHVSFNYQARPAPAHTVERPITKGDRKDLVARPFNDPGTVRANVSAETGHTVGVTYHPQGNAQGFVRASMGPLDQPTAQHMRQHQDMDSRPMIRQWGAAQREEKWDPNHPDANRRVMTLPGREQGSEVMTEAIAGYAGGRRPRRWRRGKFDNSKGK